MAQENTKSKIAEREEKILELWRENDTFKKSLEKNSKENNLVFYDGPPFATGLPHHGHILGSSAKDAIARYFTMRGKYVARRWGWDTHGLPIENIVEKELGFKTKKDIEEYGLANFNEYARSTVERYVGEWKKTVERIGRWVDFDGSYKTMDNTFIESVWWALKELHKKDAVYEGVRVLMYCPRCETPLANSEIAMDNSYKDITDISVYIKFQITSTNNQTIQKFFDENTPVSLLAWTTTPWTLPGNTAIAVNKDIVYALVRVENEILVIGKDLVAGVLKDKAHEVVGEVSGADLVGLSYAPIFDYYKNTPMPNKENTWKVWHADFVTTDKGTGIAHEAPAFGEEDMELAKANGIPHIRHVQPNGVFTDEVTDFVGLRAKPKGEKDEKDGHQKTDIEVIKVLAARGALFAKEKIIHSYPHCYRCDTPLLYYALPAWFVRVTQIKSRMQELNQTIDWVPEHLRDGRFGNILAGAPDWNISRNRFWASPLPIWKGVNSGEIEIVGSLDELRAKTKKSGNTYYAMRHGEGEHNVQSICSGGIDDPYHLTEKGKAEVRASAETLKDKQIDMLVVSPLVRSKETAHIVAGVLGLGDEHMVVDDRLRELMWGNFQGKQFAEYLKYEENHVDAYDTVIPGGESYQSAKNRIAQCLYELEQTYQGKNILLVGHGILLEVLPAIVEGADMVRSKEIIDTYAPMTAEVMHVPFVPLPHNARYELDFHRPYIDEIVLESEVGEEMRRIPEVIDCWFESGSMPFASQHFPFENESWQKETFPSDFVVEYIAQTRTWFYYMLMISTFLFDEKPFRHVVTTGNVNAEDGAKMSKSKGNFTDPLVLIDRTGVDALRLYLLGGPLMKGEDVNFADKGVEEVGRKIIGRLDNVVEFYKLYEEKLDNDVPTSTHVLDTWIVARLEEVLEKTTTCMESYDLAGAIAPFDLFVDDLSTWYLRRSRDRIKEGDLDAKETLRYVLREFAKLLAPFAPFVAEDIWQKLKGKEDAQSVHLADWSHARPLAETLAGNAVLEKMSATRTIASRALEARQKAGIKVRQPLALLSIGYSGLDSEYLTQIEEEVNVKEIVHDTALASDEVVLDTTITQALREEGVAREFIRSVQEMRKQKGLSPQDTISLSLDTDDSTKEFVKKFGDEIKRVVGASEIVFEANDGEEVSIDEYRLKVTIN